MISVDKLIAQRECIRLKEKQLTKDIKAAKQEEAAIKKANYNNQSEVLKYKNKSVMLNTENIKLRRLVALLMKDEGLTYNTIAKKLSVSPATVKGYIDGAKTRIKRNDTAPIN